MTKRFFASLALLFLTLAAPTAQAPAGKEELKLKLPKPMFIGTPTNLKSANLEAITGKSRGPFYVPEGHRPALGEEEGDLQRDAAGYRRARHDHGWREVRRRRLLRRAGPGPQWVQIDLGTSRALSAILAWHYHSQARIYRDVMVLVSDDPAFKTGVTTVFNNDHDNSSKMTAGKDKEYIEVAEGKLIRPEGCEGPLRAALVERQHDQRPEPLRRSGGLRPGEMTRAPAPLRSSRWR